MNTVACASVAGLMLLSPVAGQPLRALKFTMHIEVIQSEPATPHDWSKFVAQLARQAVPPGGADQTVIIGPTATRMEQHQAMFGVPAGVVTLFRGTDEFGFDPSARTFWKQPARLSAEELSAITSAKPEVKVDRTGRFETIGGMPAELVTTTMSMPMPADVTAAPIPGLPADLVMTFDAWVTDAVKVPGDNPMPLLDRKLLAQLGVAHPGQFTDNRFLVKAAVRLNLISGVEMIITVKDIARVEVPASTFDIPAGYKEIPPPTHRGGPPAPIARFTSSFGAASSASLKGGHR